MLSRALNPKLKRSPRAGECSLRSTFSAYGYEELGLGYMDDVPLTSFEGFDIAYSCNSVSKKFSCNNTKNGNSSESMQMTLRQVLRASVGVMGESPLAMTEKVVLSGGIICAVKRFRRVVIRKSEFGRRIERVAQIGNQCQYLVPVSAYLYAKRIKFVVCGYYPMGSLADLLAGAREQGQTALQWKHRLKIIQCIAKSIGYIHSQNHPREKHLQVNVHGDIKSSNVMIDIDFTAHLSNYGFVQLAENVMNIDDSEQTVSLSPQPERLYTEMMSRESDIHNFGVVLMDILGWPNKVSSKEEFRNNCFEFCVEGRDLKQAIKLYEIALGCTNSVPDARPTIQHILSCLEDTCYTV
ncbi:putative inactive receptor kinase At5g58300 [Primulina tabacum]|uniref:putative inactive receptor kinase At5g58300 n=1 Tax=Primulina tabacum TaxID=48773 RepID=UPI003F5AB6AE